MPAKVGGLQGLEVQSWKHSLGEEAQIRILAWKVPSWEQKWGRELLCMLEKGTQDPEV
jgi:hypothetical protein